MNTEVVDRVRPRFLLRDDADIGLGTRSSDVSPVTHPDPRDFELQAMGVTRMEPAFHFGLYPVSNRPREQFTLYRLSYESATVNTAVEPAR
jgi:hypothetical protein